MINHSHYHEILYEHKISKVDFLKLCLFDFIFYHSENIYSNLLENVHFICNFFMLYILCNMCFNILIDVKQINKINNFKKYTENHVHKSKLIVSNYKI